LASQLSQAILVLVIPALDFGELLGVTIEVLFVAVKIPYFLAHPEGYGFFPRLVVIDLADYPDFRSADAEGPTLVLATCLGD